MIVAIVSYKGGVGKTTLTANLAATLAESEQDVCTLDLDPQNSLHLHLGNIANTTLGWTTQFHTPEYPVSESPVTVEHNIHLLPYGRTTACQQDAVETRLRENNDWLPAMISEYQLEREWLLIDTPPGHSIYASAAIRHADCILVTLLSDAASLATVPAIHQQLEAYQPRTFYVFNQYEPDCSLAEDVYRHAYGLLGKQLLPIRIHRDVAVAEALAQAQSMVSHAPDLIARQDFRRLADWLLSI